MKNVVIALDRSNSQIPAVQAMALQYQVDKLNTKSVDSVVEEMKRLMEIAGLENKISPCEILSAFVKDVLLSETDHPNHVNGLEFGEALNKIMCGNHE